MIELRAAPMWVGLAANQRAAFARSITARISERGQRDIPPNLTGREIVPSATRRQNVAVEMLRIRDDSLSRNHGSIGVAM